MSSFLLVSLNIDAILGEITLHQRRKKLDKMIKGEGLGDAYAATISRIKAQQRSRSKLGMDVLMWISHSEWPLHVDEICHALGVEEGSTDLNIRNIPATETVLACCLGLVTVEKSSSTLRLVHYTLQEYLSHNPNLFLKPQSRIAEVCLTYLNFQQVSGFSPTLRSDPPTVPFIGYASCHWGTHARRETTDSVKTLALKLLDGYDKHISSKLLLLRGMSVWDQLFDWEDRPRGFTGLHGAAYFGCVEIMAALLEMNKWDVQTTDLSGNTAIAWAARRGHEGVVRILVERSDVNPDTADALFDRTPLSFAAENGHEGVVRILLGRDNVNPDTLDECGRTPLSFAAENGYEGVVRIFLGRDNVNPDILDESGRTPLSWAARSGHEGVVRILLGRGNVNPNASDEYCRTPLSFAAENGYEGVVRILLGRDNVNPDTLDESGRTPLSLAAENGHEGVVRMLLGRGDVNPNISNECGRTPLSFAAENGYEGVVRILLEGGGVNPNSPDNYGRTSLLWAAESGDEGVLRILLERDDLNPNTPDKYGLTPLTFAAENGHEGAVRILLEQSKVDPNTAGKSGRTPLSRAAQNGHEGVVRILLERNDVNPNRPDKYGRTPVSLAVRNGHERIAKLLQDRPHSIPRYVASLQPTELLLPDLPELSEPPFKRARKF